ncbi:MAG: RluA family pseudouridine synthase [Candidatus Cloacimonetes bacterium]|nr:RluA family pseudouridine synthase [Candidatus Cloacimonadota bacterium]
MSIEAQDYTFLSQESTRIDKFLSEMMPDKSRSFLQSLLVDGHVCVNNKTVVKKSFKLKAEDQIQVHVPMAVALETPAEEMNLKILYEDDHLLAVLKPWGILTHPLHPGQGGSLVSGLLHQSEFLSGINGVLRPGIVHRLDRCTSGVLIVAKEDQTHRKLQEYFANRTIQKTYYALCYGSVKENEGIIHLPLGRDPKRRTMQMVSDSGREAVSHYKVIKSWNKFHFVQIRPKTGRTHQIRVHLQSIGIPILGDTDYQGRYLPKWLKRVQLHSHSIAFVHPVSKQKMFIRTSIDADMVSVIKRLNRGEKYV